VKAAPSCARRVGQARHRLAGVAKNAEGPPGVVAADAAEELRAHQQAFVRSCGEACREADLVHLLEILVYPLPGEDRQYVARNRARLVEAAVLDFCKP
jgi:hypothetical protein